MKLSALIKDLEGLEKMGQRESNPDIDSIHYNSQTVVPGGLFVAMRGLLADGHDYIEDAVNRGTAAVVGERLVESNAVVITVKNSRKALAEISNRFYGNPSKELCLIGITGTNGKTTTTYLIENMLKQAGFKVGVIGTINYRYAGNVFKNPMTTPESLDLQKILHEMKAAGVSHVVMEVSSHAIDLERIAYCFFDVGIFTNLSQDHLDYHRDMKSYWNCKKRFFTQYLNSGPKWEKAVAVINCDHQRGIELYQQVSVKKISIGTEKGSDVRLAEYESSLKGVCGRIVTCRGDVPFTSPLAGEYNVENILCAVGAGMALNLSLDAVSNGIRETGNVPGRLEFIENDAGIFVYVDYAHTPDALLQSLSALSALKASESRLICVFGCGGDRDKAKRPLMGEIAGKYSDLTVITTDNPRTEAPVDIIRQIEKGVKKTAPRYYGDWESPGKVVEKGYAIEEDRKKAIYLAISLAGVGDVILIAGKGHETYQIIGGKIHDFDDRSVARQTLASMTFRRPA